MVEDAKIIRLNILHYQELLKLSCHTAESRTPSVKAALWEPGSMARLCS